MDEKNLNIIKDYKYGFSTDIENVKAPKGLSAVSYTHLTLPTIYSV